MREEIGDLWKYPAEYRCVTTNGLVVNKRLVMGAGVALQAKERYPNLPAMLAIYVNKFGNRPFRCEKERILTFPTKQHWKNKSELKLIKKSAELVVLIADKFEIKSIAMTRPGCGNGGLRWEDVKPVIAPILDDRFVVLELA